MSKGENIFQRKDGRREARYSKGYELPAVQRRFVQYCGGWLRGKQPEV